MVKWYNLYEFNYIFKEKIALISAEEKRHQMLNDPVELLVCRLAVPTIITMMITAFYNMADTFEYSAGVGIFLRPRLGELHFGKAW